MPEVTLSSSWDSDRSSSSSRTESSETVSPTTPSRSIGGQQLAAYPAWLSNWSEENKQEHDDWIAYTNAICDTVADWTADYDSESSSDREDDGDTYDTYPPLSPSSQWSTYPYSLLAISEELEDWPGDGHSQAGEQRGPCATPSEAQTSALVRGQPVTALPSTKCGSLVAMWSPRCSGCEVGDEAGCGSDPTHTPSSITPP